MAKKEIDPKRNYTTREAAELLGVTPDTVKAYCRNQKLNALRVGPKKQWMVTGTEISRLRKEWNLE
jgi:excisionase family DNA binding protein